MTHKILGERANIALFITRMIIGGIFIYSGWLKIHDMSSTISMFSTMDVSEFWAYVVSYGELLGGLLLILGLWTDRAAAFLSVIMLFAIYYTSSLGFGMFGLPLSMLAGLSAIIGCGAGKFTLRK